MVRPVITSSSVICRQPGRYIGWPTVAKLPDGELLVVFSGDREEHVCPFGKTQLVRSRDGGASWSAPETINDTPLDDRDAGLVVLRSGVLVVSWFTANHREPPESWRKHYGNDRLDRWTAIARAVSDADRERWLGFWTRRSTDGGRTWEPAVNSLVSAPHGPIALCDGRLLYVGNLRFGGPDAPRCAVGAAESADEGRSWRLIGEIGVPVGPEPGWLCEPHAVETADGRIVALFRNESVPDDRRYLWQSESADGGRTWSNAHITPLWGYPPHLIRLADRALLATYGFRRPPFGQRACLSRDDGRTWAINQEIVLRDDAPSHDLGYPASCQLDDGSLLTVYYQQEAPEGKTVLMATRWSLPLALDKA